MGRKRLAEALRWPLVRPFTLTPALALGGRGEAAALSASQPPAEGAGLLATARIPLSYKA